MIYEDELFAFFDDESDEFLEHHGTPHAGSVPHSGRYAWGSGETPFQREQGFYERVQYLKATHPGITNVELAAKLGIVSRFGKNKGQPSSSEFQKRYTAAKNAKEWETISEARRLRDSGMGWTDIAKTMGLSGESAARALLKKERLEKLDNYYASADALKTYVDKYKYVDISSGVETFFGFNENRFSNMVRMLEDRGYVKSTIKVDQMTTDNKTTITVLSPPGTEYADVVENKYDIRFPFQENKIIDIRGDITALGLGHVECVDSSRIQVAWDSPMDGTIELRRGVPDISLGPKDYAQVRIGVDGVAYLKGMAIYADDLPPGIDIRFNTNKKEGTPLYDTSDPDAKQVFKLMKTKADGSVDWDNPFGSTIDRDSDIMTTTKEYLDSDGIVRQSAINVVREEGDWLDWKRTVPSQVLSKNSVPLAERQLDLTLKQKQAEFAEIMSVDNNAVKQKLLIAFADKCDSSAVNLKAAPFRGQQTCVLLCDPDLPDDECYCPSLPTGTRVALVRCPFSGPWECPELTVNNESKTSQRILPKTAIDAICINKGRLNQMSGADTDGDHALVIPITSEVQLRTMKDTLHQLKDFDTKDAYPGYKGMRKIKHQTQQNEMGKVTNLITDMFMQEAPLDDIARAVKYSMVIIDSEKHNLDWRRCKKEMGIDDLKRKYQLTPEGKTGAGTIVSRAKSPRNVNERDDWRPSSKSIDPITGKKIYNYTEATYDKGKLNLKSVTLTDGRKVSLTYDKDNGGLYYTVRDKEAKKNVRHYVDDKDLPENLRGVKMDAGGWVNLTSDKSGRQYYIRYDEAVKKLVRVYVEEGDILGKKTKLREQKSTKMAEADDAYELTSGGSRDNPGYRMERVYAEYANGCKALANEARKAWLKTGGIKYDSEAYVKYRAEVDSLNQKIADARAAAPFERQAQLMAGREIAIRKYENPGMSREELSKKKGQAITAARAKIDHKKPLIEVSDREAEAIRAGAITTTMMQKIMDNVDMDSLRSQFTPRTSNGMSEAKLSMVKSLMNIKGPDGKPKYTMSQIGDMVGYDPSTIYRNLNSKK